MRLLENDGWRVEEAEDGRAALEALRRVPADTVLLDLMMPNMDGFAMCKAIRKLNQFKTVPILFITAYADPSSLDKTRAAGAQGLIEKPIMFSELLVQVLDALQGRFSLPTRLKYAS